MTNKKFFAILGVFVFLMFVGASCGKPATGPEAVKKEGEKAIGEAINAAQNVKGQFDFGQIKEWKNKNEEFTLSCQIREYKTYPEAERISTGKASYKITDVKTMDKIGLWETKAGEDFFVVYLEVKGDPANFGMPQFLDQTGTDPAPRFYLVDETGKKYSEQTSESNSAARQAGGESLMSIHANSNQWKKTAVVFTVPENISLPALVIETKVAEGQYEYYGIKLY